MMLCKNDKHWQDYLMIQDNSLKSHDIIHSTVDMMRICVLRLDQGYTLDLISIVVRFITETVNGENMALAKQYANTGIIDYCMKVLRTGFSDEEADFLKKVSGSKTLNL